LNEGVEHAFDFGEFGVRPFASVLRGVPRVVSQDELVFEFGCDAHGIIKMSCEVFLYVSSTNFRSVGGHRRGKATHLANKAVSFRFRKVSRDSINLKCECMRTMPCLQVPETIHFQP
jgi:hypothetical protein